MKSLYRMAEEAADPILAELNQALTDEERTQLADILGELGPDRWRAWGHAHREQVISFVSDTPAGRRQAWPNQTTYLLLTAASVRYVRQACIASRRLDLLEKQIPQFPHRYALATIPDAVFLALEQMRQVPLWAFEDPEHDPYQGF